MTFKTGESFRKMVRNNEKTKKSVGLTDKSKRIMNAVSSVSPTTEDTKRIVNEILSADNHYEKAKELLGEQLAEKIKSLF